MTKLFEKYLSEARNSQPADEPTLVESWTSLAVAKSFADFKYDDTKNKELMARVANNPVNKKINAIFAKIGYTECGNFALKEVAPGKYEIYGHPSAPEYEDPIPSLIVKTVGGSNKAPTFAIEIHGNNDKPIPLDEFEKYAVRLQKIAKTLKELEKLDWTKLEVV